MKNLFQKARRHLTDDQLMAFFRLAFKKDQEFPRSIAIINKCLDKGWSLDRFEEEFSRRANDPISLALQLEVTPLDKGTFKIAYGLAGGHVGDGVNGSLRFHLVAV